MRAQKAKVNLERYALVKLSKPHLLVLLKLHTLYGYEYLFFFFFFTSVKQHKIDINIDSNICLVIHRGIAKTLCIYISNIIQ